MAFPELPEHLTAQEKDLEEASPSCASTAAPEAEDLAELPRLWISGLPCPSKLDWLNPCSDDDL